MWKKTKEMKWKTAKLLWGDLFYDIAGAVLFAAGVYTFAGNADFAPGGITGISLLLNHVFGIPVGTLTLFINLPLIVISYRTLGKRFLLKTAKSMVITTFFLDVVFPVFPMYEGQTLPLSLSALRSLPPLHLPFRLQQRPAFLLRVHTTLCQSQQPMQM